MSSTPLSEWQDEFFAERVRGPASGLGGVYYREQVFGAVEVLADALPELEAVLGAANFRFFVRELLSATQPHDALGLTLVEPFLRMLLDREELSNHSVVLDQVRKDLEALGR